MIGNDEEHPNMYWQVEILPRRVSASRASRAQNLGTIVPSAMQTIAETPPSRSDLSVSSVWQQKCSKQTTPHSRSLRPRPQCHPEGLATLMLRKYIALQKYYGIALRSVETTRGRQYETPGCEKQSSSVCEGPVSSMRKRVYPPNASLIPYQIRNDEVPTALEPEVFCSSVASTNHRRLPANGLVCLTA